MLHMVAWWCRSRKIVAHIQIELCVMLFTTIFVLWITTKHSHTRDRSSDLKAIKAYKKLTRRLNDFLNESKRHIKIYFFSSSFVQQNGCVVCVVKQQTNNRIKTNRWKANRKVREWVLLSPFFLLRLVNKLFFFCELGVMLMGLMMMRSIKVVLMVFIMRWTLRVYWLFGRF